jgi:protein tyrosine/serine phosphatase
MTRRIAFEGIDNFRDFGGYVAGGNRLKRGLLYRSAHHGKATDADLEKLAALNIGVIVDLRRANERERDPSRRWSGFAAEVIDNSIGQEKADEWSTFITSSDLSLAAFRAYMLDYYTHAPFQKRHVDLYQRYFEALAATEGPLLVHCAAGKDRTGIICALTHLIAGVHGDDVREDYLLTNDAERHQARLPAIRAHIREATGRAPADDALLTVMRVESEYLDRAFEVMREAHGSIDGYLEQVLGVDAAMRSRIHDRLLG